MQKNNNKTMWVSSELDFEDLHREGRYEDIIELSQKNADMLLSLCRHRKIDKLGKSIRYGLVVLSYFERSLQKTEERSLFWAGKLMGYLEVMDRLRFADEQERMADERKRLFGTKHLDKIVLALEAHETMTQTELGELLGLKASTLSEVLKKVRKTHLVQVRPFGKYKIYSLTKDGIRYSAILRSKGQSMFQQPSKETAEIKYPNRAYINNHREQSLLIPKFSAMCFLQENDNRITTPFITSNGGENGQNTCVLEGELLKNEKVG